MPLNLQVSRFPLLLLFPVLFPFFFTKQLPALCRGCHGLRFPFQSPVTWEGRAGGSRLKSGSKGALCGGVVIRNLHVTLLRFSVSCVTGTIGPTIRFYEKCA